MSNSQGPFKVKASILATTDAKQRALADKLFDKAFSRPRDARSDAYKTGVKAALLFRIASVAIEQPFKMGTAQADAYLAGIDEGHMIWRDHQAGVKDD